MYKYFGTKLRCISFLWKHLSREKNSHDTHKSQLRTGMSIFKTGNCFICDPMNLFPHTSYCNTWYSFQNLLFYLLVAGNANFKMPRTCLTLCGMTQPATAAPLIVDKSNVDKGLASRFLWIFPKPVFKPFSALEVSANEQLKEDAENFTRHLGNIFHKYLIIQY